MRQSIQQISLLVLTLFICLNVEAQNGYYQIDGNNCSPTNTSDEWGPSSAGDPIGDTDAAGSDLVNYWYDYNSDTDEFCFAFERYSPQTNGPTATYVIYFDLDCDTTTGYTGFGQGGEVAIGLEWKVNGPWEVIQFVNGQNATTILGNAYVGQSICGDATSAGQFAEFCFNLSDLLVEGYDPCSCSAIGIPGVVTLAGGNITSQPKDVIEGLIDASILVNEVPIAVTNISPQIVCLGDPISFDGTLSTDSFPIPDPLTYAWDFSYDGVVFNTESTLSQGSYVYSNVGDYTILFEVMDSYGCPDTVSTQVSVIDAPIANINLGFDNCNLSIAYDGTSSVDNAGADNLVYSWDFGDGQTSSTNSGPITYSTCGEYTITLTVTDPDGLPGCETSTTTQTITFDNEPPVVTCPSISTSFCTVDSFPPYTSIVDFTNAGGTVSDNCTVDTIILLSETNNGNSCGGQILRDYIVLDECGNSAICSQTITIDDDLAPVLNCPPTFYAMCDVSEAPQINSYFEFLFEGGSVSDDCGIDPATFTFVSETSDNGTCPETVTRNFSITDNCGNVGYCDFTIIVGDTIPPVMVSPPAGNAICFYHETNAFQDIDDFVGAGGEISDNCGIDSSSFNLVNEISNNLTCPETVDRIYEVLDLSLIHI